MDTPAAKPCYLEEPIEMLHEEALISEYHQILESVKIEQFGFEGVGAKHQESHEVEASTTHSTNEES